MLWLPLVLSKGRKRRVLTKSCDIPQPVSEILTTALSSVVAFSPQHGLDYFLFRRKDQPKSNPYPLAHDHAESIDFLDIVFQLEKTFDLKIPRAELFPGPADLGDSESLVEDGKLTDEGVSQLRAKLPHANVDDTWFHEENVFSIRQVAAVSAFGAAPKPNPLHMYAGLTIALA